MPTTVQRFIGMVGRIVCQVVSDGVCSSPYRLEDETFHVPEQIGNILCDHSKTPMLGHFFGRRSFIGFPGCLYYYFRFPLNYYITCLVSLKNLEPFFHGRDFHFIVCTLAQSFAIYVDNFPLLIPNYASDSCWPWVTSRGPIEVQFQKPIRRMNPSLWLRGYVLPECVGIWVLSIAEVKGFQNSLVFDRDLVSWGSFAFDEDQLADVLD